MKLESVIRVPGLRCVKTGVNIPWAQCLYADSIFFHFQLQRFGKTIDVCLCSAIG